MGCEASSQNATSAAPGIAPGGDSLDPARFAASYQTDPRLAGHIRGFDAPFFQAGLAGYSDAAMRIIARRQGCPLCVTEALLDRTLLAGGRGFAKADLGELHDNVPGGQEDAPLVGQIMGSEPAEMAAAALKMVEQGKRSNWAYRNLAYDDLPTHTVKKWEGKPWEGAEQIEAQPDDNSNAFGAIDVNLACPVKKIAKKARGGHWLAAPEGAIKILEAVRDAVPDDIPVTVKMRRGFDDTPEMIENFYKVFDAAYDTGCAWVVVHGRTVQQKYVGPSRWDMLRDIVQRKHPGKHTERVVLTSGDIWNVNDIFRMLEYVGSHAVSVARGCIGNPWIFRQARDMLAGKEPAAPTIEEQREVLTQHFDLALKVNESLTKRPELFTGRTMRKFGIRFAAHHPRGEEVRKRFIAVENVEDWRAVLDEFYEPETAGV